MQMIPQPAIWTLLLAGCSFGDPEHWSDQLEPSGPCWNINLVNGIDESSTAELHNIFQCLNKDGNIEALTALDQAMDAQDRESNPVGLSVAKLSNTLPTSGYDIFGLAGKALQVIETYSSDADLVLESIVEGIYATPYSQVTDNFDLGAEQNLEAGLFVPGAAILSSGAQQLLDAGPDGQSEVIDSLDSDLLQDTLCTLSGIVEAEDPEIRQIGDHLLRNLGYAWVYSSDMDNNIWMGPHDNSLRNLVEAAQLGSETGPIQSLKEPLGALLSDDMVQLNTVTVLQVATQEGDIAKLPTQILYMASVDASGNPLASSGKTSALQAGARLLHNANAEIECSIDIPLFGSFEIELGNLSVDILQRLAEMDESSAVDSVELLGDVLDLGSIQTILEFLLVDTGLCPDLNPILTDIEVLNRLNDPQVGNLVGVIHGMLDAVYREGEFNRLQETVDLLAALHTEQLLPPIEEVLRDLESTQLMADLTTTVTTIIDPSKLPTDACLGEATPLDFNQLWDVMEEAAHSGSPNNILTDIAYDALHKEPIWTLMANTSSLAANDDARIHELPNLMVKIWLNEHDSVDTDQLRKAIEDEALWSMSLKILENEAIIQSVTKPTDQTEGPLPFVARLITSDTVTVMLQTIDFVLDSLGVNENSPS